jgi:putative ABC transport system substrate-binding protein
MIRRREFIAGLGSAAAWPIAAWAQQPTMPVIGVLSVVRVPTRPTSSFGEGLREQGYVVGRNLAIEYRFSDPFSSPNQMPNLAAEFKSSR